LPRRGGAGRTSVNYHAYHFQRSKKYSD